MLKVTIDYDYDVDSPSGCDGSWTLISFNPSHKSYRPTEEYLYCDGDDNVSSLSAELAIKLKNGLAFHLDYFEHGNCVWSRHGRGPQCRWDNSQHAGLLVWEHDPSDMGAETYADRAKDADGFLAEYTAWCNGECYYYSIDRVGECSHCGHRTQEELLDSCGGFIGSDYMLQEIAYVLDRHPGEEVEYDGDYGWLGQHIKRSATAI